MDTPAVYASYEERRDAEATRVSARDEELEHALDDLDQWFQSQNCQESGVSEAHVLKNASAEVALAAVEHARQSSSRTLAARAFPVSEIGELKFVEAPLERMRELVDELAAHQDYLKVRDEYCRLSIQMNLEGRLAPAFRPVLTLGKKWGDAIFMVIYRDQLVIDCHWLQSTKQTVHVRDKDRQWKPLFYKNKPFPFGLAWSFAHERWGKTHRAMGMLGLTPFQQFQMCALREDELKAKIEALEKPKGNGKGNKSTPAPISYFEQGLNEWCERDRRILKHRDTYIAVWRARSYLGKGATVSQVGRLVAFMLGEEPKDDKSIRTKEENIRRHILGDSWGRT